MTTHSKAPHTRAGWRLSDLRDRGRLADLHDTAAHGVTTAAGELIHHGAAPGRAALAFFVPDRIEVLGKHTDYAGGRALIAASEQGFSVVALPRTDRRLRIFDAGRRRRLEIKVDKNLEEPTRRWARYPAVVARRLARNFPGDAAYRPLHGVDIAFTSNLPAAAGMSSSSALVVAIFLALERSNNMNSRLEYRAEIRDQEDVAGYCAAIENGAAFGRLDGDRGVGTFGGSEDHTAILCSHRGELAQYRFCPVDLERRITLPSNLVFAIGVSGVRASKTGPARDAYNRLATLAAEVTASWRRFASDRPLHMGAILAESSLDELCRVLRKDSPANFTVEEIINRARHFHTESEEILPEAAWALARGDLDGFGKLVDRSQKLGAELLGNQILETQFLAESARKGGAVAASAFGAGFGGAVWALVERDRADAFLEDWSARYQGGFPERALTSPVEGGVGKRRESMFFLTGAGPGATEIFNREHDNDERDEP